MYGAKQMANCTIDNIFDSMKQDIIIVPGLQMRKRRLQEVRDLSCLQNRADTQGVQGDGED